ncbi:MAG: AAA family ATPase [Desulfobacterales bacterium]|nr:AAA family ATPase [Desulfobacterales bacterium]
MGKHILFHSFRRGVGRTSVMASLSHLLATRGNRVAVVDANIQFPSLHSFFGLEDAAIKYTINDYLLGKCDIEKIIYAVSPYMTTKTSGEVYCIPAASRPGKIKALANDEWDMELMKAGLRQLDETLRLDALMIETRTGLNEEIMKFMPMSDVLLFLIRPDQQDYQGTSILLDMASGIEARRLMLVVNETPDALDPEKVKAESERILGHEIVAMLPHLEEMMTLAGAGVFADHFPDHPWTVRLDSLAGLLMA